MQSYFAALRGGAIWCYLFGYMFCALLEKMERERERDSDERKAERGREQTNGV